MLNKRIGSLLLLEEVFILLKESLEHCPFDQNNCSPTKKHLARFKQLLGLEFSFWLSETGCLFFAVLKASQRHLDTILDDATNKHHTKNIYENLLSLSQLTMSIGMDADQATECLLKLNEYTSSDEYLINDSKHVINAALSQLQFDICNLISSQQYE